MGGETHTVHPLAAKRAGELDMGPSDGDGEHGSAAEIAGGVRSSGGERISSETKTGFPVVEGSAQQKCFGCWRCRRVGGGAVPPGTGWVPLTSGPPQSCILGGTLDLFRAAGYLVSMDRFCRCKGRTMGRRWTRSMTSRHDPSLFGVTITVPRSKLHLHHWQQSAILRVRRRWHEGAAVKF